MKKIFALATVAAAIFAMTSCGGSNGSGEEIYRSY
jgi:predicted small secreted protein